MEGFKQFKSGVKSMKNFSPLIFSLFIACTNAPVNLEGVDLGQWKSDRQGCKQFRAGALEQIINQKESLLAKSESDILNILGKPDQIELYKRNQKLFHYRISPASTCPKIDSLNIELMIRFNAMGRAKEIYATPNNQL